MTRLKTDGTIDILTEKMSTPVKYTVTLSEDEVEKRKKECYEKVKHNIEVQGFRKGNVPQDVAVKHLGVDRVYKLMVDKIIRDIITKEKIIVDYRDFKFFGDLKKKTEFIVEFIAEVKPIVNLILLDKINVDKFEEPEEIVDLSKSINEELKRSETFVDSSKEVLENLDIAVIDFKGCLEGQIKPFPGGTSNNFQIKINDLVNGKKQFIDNFEDQLIGMKVNEFRDVKVKFPDDYHDKKLSGKNAIFKVKLNVIKEKIVPVYDDEFAKSKGFDTVKDFEENLRTKIIEKNKKNSIEGFKKKILTSMLEQIEISPIPQSMIDRENNREWQSLLRKMGKTEEELLKENKNISKEAYFDNITQKSIETLKVGLILEEVSKKYKIESSEEEVLKHTLKISNFLQYDSDREERIKKELLSNKQQFDFMKRSLINEKALDFLFEEMSK